MGDFSNYEKQAPRAGQTVAHEVTELRNPDGSHPVVHLEHIGRTNASFMEWVLASAGKSADEQKRDERELMIEHSARKLERAYFSDGTLATDADLPAFVRAMPLAAFERMASVAMDAANYCEYPIAIAPQALAEK
jgi:hypothetical protein